ncbi:MAG: zinc ribbon domain-containing protein [Candidatus Sumerlaeota bacterium]|nr:zinc ribbon domain-containing protein [Candidatus Sumerlaeota bacterium]
MPVYQYKHLAPTDCPLGESFDTVQSMRDKAHATCPRCGAPVRRLISRVFVATAIGDSQLKSMGFTKLVRRDQGVYENVTATGRESRYMEAGKPETLPDLKRKIGD